MIGFHATQPKITGSLMLKIAGTTQARPKAFNLLLFDLASMITNGKVHPIPPIHMYAE